MRKYLYSLLPLKKGVVVVRGATGERGGAMETTEMGGRVPP